jgi:hypothetical protein
LQADATVRTPAGAAPDDEKVSLDLRHLGSPAPLRGSYQSLERQNQRLEAEGLERIEDDRDLEGRIAHKVLVPLPASGNLSIYKDLPAQRRYCRPWTARFLSDLAAAHNRAFHRPIEVSSAVRTVDYQKRLMGSNGNAAPAEGDVVSPHLTGAAVDLPKDGYSRQELAWMRRRLLSLQQAGKIDVEEEFQQACFHVTVYKNYPARTADRPGTRPAPVHLSSTPARPATAPAHSVAAKSDPASMRTAPPPKPLVRPSRVPATQAVEPLEVVVPGV